MLNKYFNDLRLKCLINVGIIKGGAKYTGGAPESKNKKWQSSDLTYGIRICGQVSANVCLGD